MEATTPTSASLLRRSGLLGILLVLVVSAFAGSSLGIATAGSAHAAHPSTFLGYNVSFHETGLPFGTTWSVTYNGVTLSLAGRTITFPEVLNGTWAFTVPSPVSGENANRTSGMVTVTGAAPPTTDITFATPPGHYTVTFTETGIPAGATQFNVTFNNTVYTAGAGGLGGLTITIPAVVNNTYTFSVAQQYGLYPSPVGGSITVNGANPAPQAIAFGPAPGHYTVTFSETGLPRTATVFNVTFNGTVYAATVGGGGGLTITIPDVVNNTLGYAFSVAVQYGLYPIPSAGTIVVNGASPANQVIAFGPPSGHYDVAFRETGLAAGDVWHLTFNGSVYVATAPGFGAATITITNVVNNTAGYAWNTTYPGLVATPPSGTVVVSGAAPARTNIVFSTPPGHYSVEFTESGLGAFVTSWNVTFNGTVYAANGFSFTGAPTITISGVVNNTAGYSFTVAQQYGLFPTPSAGSITVNGANPGPTNIAFAGPPPGASPVWFNETGLPGGSPWSVDVGGVTVPSGGSSSILTFVAANPSVPWHLLSIPGWNATPSSGAIDVAAGVHVSTSIVWSRASSVFPATFAETGLPTGTTWSVTFNGVAYSATAPASVVTTAVANGTYTWSISSIWRWTPTPGSGSLTIAGATPQAISWAQAAVTYSAFFSETGLPGGTTWSVTVGALSPVSESTSTLAVSDLLNNTAGYSWSVSATGYTASPSSGTLPVNGMNATQAVTFAAVPSTFVVSFSEQGLPSGQSWTVVFNQVSMTSPAGSSISFTVADGTYSYTVSPPSGYTTNQGSGSITVAGSAVSQTITFSKSSSSSTNSLGSTGMYELYALVAAVVVVAAIVAVLLMRRRKGAVPATMAAAGGAGAGATAWAASPAPGSMDEPSASSSMPPPSSDGVQVDDSTAPSPAAGPDSDSS